MARRKQGRAVCLQGLLLIVAFIFFAHYVSFISTDEKPDVETSRQLTSRPAHASEQVSLPPRPPNLPTNSVPTSASLSTVSAAHSSSPPPPTTTPSVRSRLLPFATSNVTIVSGEGSATNRRQNPREPKPLTQPLPPQSSALVPLSEKHPRESSLRLPPLPLVTDVPKPQATKPTDEWSLRVKGKAQCLASADTEAPPALAEAVSVSFFLYHTRKAAGTTLRAFLERLCDEQAQKRRRWARSSSSSSGGGGPRQRQRRGMGAAAGSACLYESEGLSLDPGFLPLANAAPPPKAAAAAAASVTVTVTTLRHPVDRVLSLYWYEHVGWWDGIQHDLGKLKPLAAWLEHWTDGSSWKQSFERTNPGSTYVEPSDYFVKCLSGWTGPGRATRADLERAKAALAGFDVVLLTEKLADPSHLSVLRLLLGTDLVQMKKGKGSTGSASDTHALKADEEPKRRLGNKLLGPGGEAAARKLIEGLNTLDLELWEFANALVDERAALAAARLEGGAAGAAAAAVNQRGGAQQLGSAGAGSPLEPLCSRALRSQGFPGRLSRKLGIHRPPGHKQ